MTEQPKPPNNLRDIQKLFAQTAMTPFDFDNETEPQTKLFPQTIINEMAKAKELSGTQRILNYNQQYWYRLFSTMQEEMPLLVKHLDYREFNHLISDYLTCLPSRSYTLNHLTNQLLKFIEDNRFWCRPIIIEIIKLEIIFIRAFDALETNEDLRLLPLTSEDLMVLQEKGFGFQPSLYLWEENWNLVQSRKMILLSDDPDEYEINLKEEKSYWCIYRLKNRIYQEPLMRVQYLLLSSLKEGASLVQAFESLEDKINDEETLLIESEVMNWFQKWVSLSWFTMPRGFKKA